MIQGMPLRSFVSLVVACVVGVGCGGAPPPSDEPTTAKEKLAREDKANGEAGPGAKKWGGWRYKGERDDCFFVVGAHCYKTEPAACAAAKCKTPKKCVATGAGPATLTCK